MFYEALYRKWRPKVFEDIIGQDETVTILKNQIKYSNIAHAYLFTGMRGTGKTSTARIFARAVNCMNPKESNPCNTCEICEGILKESIMDVVEIDAASNTGVDNIREIRENTKYNPSRGKYKIYIIDEVHMLSRGAFNALLKTLEEPPAHVIFILSTTEPHKVPATILSRCQRFDFKPIKTKDIIGQLSLVCKEISIGYEEAALHLIALNSGGSVRDALSILDRCVSFDNETLKYDDVINILGAVNYESIFNLVEGIAKESIHDVLVLINEIFTEGKDAGQLMKDLIFHFRNLLLIKMDVKIDDFLVLPEERLKQFKEQSKLFNVNQVSSFIYTLSDIDSKLKYSSQPRILMEIAVASLCNRESDDSLEGIIERVKRLEKIIASGKADVGRDDKGIQNYREDRIEKAVPDSADQKQDVVGEQGDKETVEIEHVKAYIKQKVESDSKEELKDDKGIEIGEESKNGGKLEDDEKSEPKDDGKSESNDDEKSESEDDEKSESNDDEKSEPNDDEKSEPKNDEKSEDSRKSKDSKIPRDDGKPEDSKGPKDDKKSEDSEKSEGNKGSKDNTRALNTIKGVWEQILDQSKKDGKTYVGTYLKEGTPKELKKGILTILFKKGFELHLDRLNKREIKEYISNIITKFTGQDVEISFVTENGPIISGDLNEQKDSMQEPEKGLPEMPDQVDPLRKLEEILPEEVFDMLEIKDG